MQVELYKENALNFVALQKKHLLRYSHHWFWGFRVDKPVKESLFDLATQLDSDAENRNKLEHQIETIGERTWLVRALYWLFNYKQYRLHFYQLQAYIALKCYQQGSEMLGEEDKRKVELDGAFWTDSLRVVTQWTVVPLGTHVVRGFSWFYELAMPTLSAGIKYIKAPWEAAPPAEGAASPAPQSTTGNFNVQTEMLSSLEVLGIIKQPGASLSVTELKKAYRKRCLETHPDKAGEASREAFIAVQEAYEGILSLLEHDHAGSEREDEALANIAALRRDMAEIRADYRVMEERSRKQAADLAANSAALAALGVQSAAQDAALAANSAALAALGAQSAAQDAALAALGARSAAQDAALVVTGGSLAAERGEHNALAERLAALRGNVGPSAADGASQAPGFFPPAPPASEASTAAPGTSASRAV